MSGKESSTGNVVLRRFKDLRTNAFALGVVAILLFGLGYSFGNGWVKFEGFSNLSSMSPSAEEQASLSTEGLQEIYDELQKNYDGDIDAEALLSGLKKGAVAAVGDAYTEYLTPEETDTFNADLNGTFEGIGAELSKEGSFIIIVAPIKGAPAEIAGLRAQDAVIEIDGEPAVDITVSEAVNRIRGEKGTEVVLTIAREGERVEVPITRARIDIPSVEWRREGDVGIIEVSRFSDDTTRLAEKAADEFVETGVTKVVLDMRGNPGGLLKQAVSLANIWLPRGTTVLEERRDGETVQTFTTSKASTLKNVETVVLINEGSASAAEIVAGALKDHDRATLVGKTSYGKGSVQQILPLKSGGSLKVTIARWYTPGGKNIDKEGITPDIEVETTAEDSKKGVDPQLDAAKENL